MQSSNADGTTAKYRNMMWDSIIYADKDAENWDFEAHTKATN